jgi:hypothetical protein
MTAIYALIGENASLTWYYQAKPTYTAQDSQALAQAIQANIGLPFRDLTSSAKRLFDQVRESHGRTRQAALATKDDIASEASATPPIVSATLIFILCTLVVLAGILTPFAQQQYYGAQIQQMEAAYPQIRDPLTSDTLSWTPTPPDAADSFTFSSNGYVFTSATCCALSSHINGVMGDGLVEITMRQVADFDLSPAGLLFRADPSTHTALVVAITPSAEWKLLQFTLGADGSLTHERELRYEGVIFGVGAIHRGPDATNQLAVLMRGSSYTFFVNGQFVGGYQANDLPQTGQVGCMQRDSAIC